MHADRFFAAVLINFNAVYYFLTADNYVFFVSLRTVRALRNHDADIFIGNACKIQFINNMNENLVCMHKAGNITYNNCYFFALVNALLQRFAVNRLAHCF